MTLKKTNMTVLEQLAWKRCAMLQKKLDTAHARIRKLEAFALRVRDHVVDEFASSEDYSCEDTWEEAERFVGKAPEE